MRRDRGIALVELLATLVVLGFISVLIVAGVGTGRRVWERADGSAAGGIAVENAQAVLRGRLARAFPATRFDASAPYADFRGEPKRLAFLGPDSDARRPSALRRYVLSLNVAGDLVLSSVSDVAAGDAPQPDSLVLLRGAQGLDIAYFGAAPPDNVPRWRFGWNNRPTPPALVRVRVQFAEGDRRWWPDLIVHPYAMIDSLCALDLQSHRCKGRT